MRQISTNMRLKAVPLACVNGLLILELVVLRRSCICGMEKIRCYPHGFALSITSVEGVFLKNEIWDYYSALCLQDVRLDRKDQIIEQNDK